MATQSGRSDQLPDYWPLMAAYHRVREPLYRRIIAEAGMDRASLVLDGGRGDAFYSRLLADSLGPTARVVAVDHNRRMLQTPAGHDPVLRCEGDLEQLGFLGGAFDVVWLCRVMHSAPDPQRRLAEISRLLRPGGRLIVVENDFAHCPILSLPPDFEQRLLEAGRRYLQDHTAGLASPDRYYSARYLLFLPPIKRFTPSVLIRRRRPTFSTAILNQIRVWERGDAEALAGGFAPDGEIVVPGRVIKGRDALRAAVMRFASRHRDVKVTLRWMVFGENCAAVEYRWEDTKNETGARYAAAVWVDFRGGLITRWRECWDSETPKGSSG